MTLNQERNFPIAFECYIDHGEFNNDKVRDHDQPRRNARAAADERCNLMFSKNFMLPVVLHNFRGY